MESIDLTQTAIIVVVIAAAVIVVVALLKGRGVKVWWGDKGVGADAERNVNQSVTASGQDSSVKRVKMRAGGTGQAKMVVDADKGGNIEDVDLNAGEDNGQDA